MTKDSKERLFKQVYAYELLKIAEGDFASAQALASVKKGRTENICYLAQQAIEKALKAVLVWKQIAFPLVHDASTLVAKMPTGLLPPHDYDLGLLTQYATVRRYEEGAVELTPEDIQGVTQAASDVLNWAKSIIPEQK